MTCSFSPDCGRVRRPARKQRGLIVVVIGAIVGAAASTLAFGAKKATEQQLARDYALAACLIHHYAGSSIAQDAESWAQGLVEAGSLPANAYPRLNELAKGIPPGPPFTRDGRPVPLASCIDWHRSRELSREVQRLEGAAPGTNRPKAAGK